MYGFKAFVLDVHNSAIVSVMEKCEFGHNFSDILYNCLKNSVVLLEQDYTILLLPFGGVLFPF